MNVKIGAEVEALVDNQKKCTGVVLSVNTKFVSVVFSGKNTNLLEVGNIVEPTGNMISLSTKTVWSSCGHFMSNI